MPEFKHSLNECDIMWVSQSEFLNRRFEADVVMSSDSKVDSKTDD